MSKNGHNHHDEDAKPEAVNSDSPDFFAMLFDANTPELRQVADLATKIHTLVNVELAKADPPLSLSGMIAAIQAVATVAHIGYGGASQDQAFLAGNARLLQLFRAAGDIEVTARPN